MTNDEIPIKDNGGYLDLDPVVRVNWKSRYADLKRQNGGLLRYADQCCRARHETEQRAIHTDNALREELENLQACLSSKTFDCACWRNGALIMFAIDLVAVAVWLFSNGGCAQ